MMNYAKQALFAPVLATILLLTAACGFLGVKAPETFAERTAAAYASVASVRDAATELLVAGKISVEDAENVQAQADTARAGIDIARQIEATDPSAAENRLNAIIVGLTALQAYLGGKS